MPALQTGTDRLSSIEQAKSLASQRSSTKPFLASLLSAGAAVFATALYPLLASILANTIHQADSNELSAKLTALVVVACLYAIVTFLLVFWQSARRSDATVQYAQLFLHEVAATEQFKEDSDELRRVADDIHGKYEALAVEHAADRAFQEAAETAMHTLVKALRTPLERSWMVSEESQQMSPLEIREYVLRLLQFCALLLEPDPRQRTIRCGLLLRHPSRQYWFPLVTYYPGREFYVSKTQIIRGRRPDYLIRRFRDYMEEHGAGPAFGRRCFDCIPDTDEFIEAQGEDNERFSPYTTHQREYVKSILGVVMYYHDRETDERRDLGILSFDSSTPRALSEERYIAALSMLKVAYRILGIRLARICEKPLLMQELYGRALDLDD